MFSSWTLATVASSDFWQVFMQGQTAYIDFSLKICTCACMDIVHTFFKTFFWFWKFSWNNFTKSNSRRENKKRSRYYSTWLVVSPCLNPPSSRPLNNAHTIAAAAATTAACCTSANNPSNGGAATFLFFSFLSLLCFSLSVVQRSSAQTNLVSFSFSPSHSNRKGWVMNLLSFSHALFFSCPCPTRLPRMTRINICDTQRVNRAIWSDRGYFLDRSMNQIII